MSGIVIVNVDNDYCDELIYSYQLIKEADDTYSVYVSRDVLRGHYECKNIESFFDAYRELNEAIAHHEGETV